MSPRLAGATITFGRCATPLSRNSAPTCSSPIAAVADHPLAERQQRVVYGTVLHRDLLNESVGLGLMPLLQCRKYSRG